MGIAVYPRLDKLLRERDLTVAELERRIERQFGLKVDPKTLYRLTHADPVQRADLEIAGAAAVVLGVGLDDLFDVQATSASEADAAVSFDLTPAQNRRLAELFDRQGRIGLAPEEQAELDDLVSEYGRRLHERRIREIARERGVALEEARRDTARELDEAVRWWEAFQSDPEPRRALARSPNARRRRSAG